MVPHLSLDTCLFSYGQLSKLSHLYIGILMKTIKYKTHKNTTNKKKISPKPSLLKTNIVASFFFYIISDTV